MRTIALRFAENFAPACGTIAARRRVINERGAVWYGKLGSPVSAAAADAILGQDDPAIPLVHCGGADRWRAHVDSIQRGTPPLDLIPEYYREQASDFGCWFRDLRCERAKKDVMTRCHVTSSGKPLPRASRRSISPYFIVDYLGDVGDDNWVGCPSKKG